MTATVAITGASGLLGSALAAQLASSGHRVRALLRRTTGDDPLNVRARLRQHDMEIVACDVTDAAAVHRAIDGCSHVAHLAAATSAASGTLAAIRAVNVEGTRNVADAARRAGVQRLVYASTLGVYGFVNGEVLDECSPLRPNTPYRRAKLDGEQVLQSPEMAGTLETVVLRLTTTVGAFCTRLDPLMRGIRAGGFRLIGDGANHLDLLPVDDVVRGIVQALFTPGIGGRHYVLGAAQPTTVREFTSTIAHVLGVKAPTVGPPRWPYAIIMRHAHVIAGHSPAISRLLHEREILVADKRSSSAQAQMDFGFAPKGSSEEAVRAMAEAFRARSGP